MVVQVTRQAWAGQARLCHRQYLSSANKNYSMPATLAADTSCKEIILFIDQWADLLEQENYEEAWALVDAEPFWTAELLREVIKGHGDEPDAHVTLHNNGTALDGVGNLHPFQQRKEVEWYTKKRSEEEGIGWFDEDRGDVWYDLNINGLGSDLTATFNLEKRKGRLHIILQDIHVM
jgi:hypothetical protein